MSLNRVCLIGRLTRDAELRTTSSGKEVASFSIAVDRRGRSGEDKTADFFRVTAWEQSARFVCQYLGKGRLIAVEGRLQSRKYTASDGTERESVEVVAESVQGLDRPKDENGDRGASHERPDVRAQAPLPDEDEFDPFADD